MDIDLDLYRHEVRVATNPLVRLSAIDVSPDHPQMKKAETQVSLEALSRCAFRCQAFYHWTISKMQELRQQAHHRLVGDAPR